MKNDRLISARKKKGLTQEQLAELFGYKKSTVSNWECGYSTPTIHDALKLAEILDSEVVYLFSRNNVQVSYTSLTNSCLKEVMTTG